MADVIFEELFSDKAALEYLEQIEKQLADVGKQADKAGQELDDAFNPSGFGLGVSDALDGLRKKYAELQRASVTLRNALRNATDPTAIKLYKSGIDDLDKGMKTLETSAKKAGVNLKEVNKEVSTGKQVFREFFGEFTKVALITAAIQKVIEFTKYAVGLAEQTRVAKLQFEAFTGSAEQAGDIVSRLQGFAAEKFLNTGDILQAGKALLAFGEEADNLTPVLSRVADISAATGKNFNELVTIYGKARAAGVLYAEDINQLVDAGIPIIQEFAKQMGVSNDAVKKLASEGKISFEELQLAFFNLTKEGGKFADQAELNAFTIGGAWRGLVAELEPAINQIGEFFSFAAQKTINTAKEFIGDIKSLFGADEAKEIGAFFDIPVKESKAADDELKKLEEAAAKRRAELAKQNSKQSADAAAKRRQQRLEEFNRLLADVDAQALALDISTTFNPVERVEKQNKDALKAAAELQKRLTELATTPAQKKAVEESMRQLFDEINKAYIEESAKAAAELEKLRGGKIREALNPLPPLETLKRDVTDVFKEIQLGIEIAVINAKPKSLAEILGLTPEQFEGLKEAAGKVVGVFNEMADARVRDADAAVDAASRRVTAAQEALDRELEIAEQGFANDVNLKKRELEEAKKLQEEAEKERAKAVKTQILLDSVNQISSLVTASANIFKSLSSIPFVGIPLAIAAIATMFGAFAKAKADALKAASVPKFRKGTKLEGRSHEGGGMAISDEYGQVVGEAEGGEWLIGTKPSREHDTFLRRLNRGEFSGVDLNGLVPRPAAANPLTESAGRIGEVERQRREIETGQHYAAMVAAYEKSAGRIVEAIQAKEVVFPLPNGYKVKTRKGRHTVTETVKFGQ